MRLIIATFVHQIVDLPLQFPDLYYLTLVPQMMTILLVLHLRRVVAVTRDKTRYRILVKHIFRLIFFFYCH